MKKHWIFLPLVITLCMTCVVKPCTLHAQNISPHDTSYYVTYPGTLTARFYLSKKYTAFVLQAAGEEADLEYRPNTQLNMGIGATYNNLSFNIAYGFGFLNPDDEKGKTKSIDLQLHFYPHKWSLDALAISHKGLYLYPEGYASPNSNGYYYRPDVKQNFIGLSAFRVLNAERFSYNAAMIQNEWQRKSAGSLLLGGQAYYGHMSGDSALVPTEVDKTFPQAAGINRINFFSVGPGVGYAYTLVIKNHFFVTGSMVAGFNLNFSSEEGVNDKKNKVAADPAVIYKAAIGYNSSTWNISANWAANSLWVRRASSSKEYSMPAGNYRIILSKKIVLKKH